MRTKRYERYKYVLNRLPSRSRCGNIYHHESGVVGNPRRGYQILDLIVGLVGHPVVDVHAGQLGIDDKVHFVYVVFEHVGHAFLQRQPL